jgi:predicted alpha/beta hydrolase family esterase
MRTAEADILLVAGLHGVTPDHWLARWEGRLKTARLVRQHDWSRPSRQAWMAAFALAAASGSRPLVVVGHGLGTTTILAALPTIERPIAGAFLVAPTSDRAIRANPAIDPDFVPLPHTPLPFPAHVLASSNDPTCSIDEAEALAHAWGASFANVGALGHVDPAAGYGPWPEGLMSFGGFLARLPEP